MNSLRILLRQQPRLEVPGDYDFHLRARIARAQSDRQTAATGVFSLAGTDLWRVVREWAGNLQTNFGLDLRGGVAATAAAAALVVGLSLYHTSEESAPSVPNSDLASVRQSETGSLPASTILPSDNTAGEALTEPMALRQASRNPRSRATLTQTKAADPLAALPGETIALDASASYSDFPVESAWRVYNSERREMISSAQQTTYLGAESSPRLVRGGAKEVGFVPSI
ncbi:MAG: hypothetical protein ACO394_07185 [Blastocatellia bacterium]